MKLKTVLDSRISVMKDEGDTELSVQTHLDRLLTLQSYLNNELRMSKSGKEHRLNIEIVPNAKVWLASPITNTKYKALPDWVAKLLFYMGGKGWHVIDPKRDKDIRFKKWDNSEFIVAYDLFLLSQCDLVVCDMTKGASFGATVEVLEAIRLGIPVLMVYNKKIELSPFAIEFSTYRCPKEELIVTLNYMFNDRRLNLNAKGEA